MMRRKATRILDFSEDLFQTDMRYVVKGGFWVFLGKGFGILLGFLLSVGFANLLPADSYGIYRFILSMATIAGTFTLTGMTTAIMQSAARGDNSVLRTGFNTHLRWSIGTAVVAFGIAGYYFINDNLTLSLSMLIVGVFMPFLESSKLYNTFLIGKKDFKRSTMLGFTRKAVPTTLLLVAIFFTSNPVLITLTYFATSSIIMLSLYLSVRRYYPETGTQESRKNLVSFSKHVSVVNAIDSISGNLSTVLLFHFFGAAPVAVYAFALVFPNQFRSIAQNIGTLAFPKMVSIPLNELKKTLPRKMLILFIPSALVYIGYVFAAPYLFSWFFPKYMDSVLFSQVISATILLTPFMLIKNVFGTHKKVKELYVMKITTSIVRIVLMVTLLPLFGIWGIVASTLGIRVFDVALMFYLYRKLK